MKKITIKLDDNQYTRVIASCNKRNRSAAGLAKHMLLQVVRDNKVASWEFFEDISTMQKQIFQMIAKVKV